MGRLRAFGGRVGYAPDQHLMTRRAEGNCDIPQPQITVMTSMEEIGIAFGYSALAIAFPTSQRHRRTMNVKAARIGTVNIKKAAIMASSVGQVDANSDHCLGGSTNSNTGPRRGQSRPLGLASPRGLNRFGLSRAD